MLLLQGVMWYLFPDRAVSRFFQNLQLIQADEELGHVDIIHNFWRHVQGRYNRSEVQDWLQQIFRVLGSIDGEPSPEAFCKATLEEAGQSEEDFEGFVANGRPTAFMDFW